MGDLPRGTKITMIPSFRMNRDKKVVQDVNRVHFPVRYTLLVIKVTVSNVYSCVSYKRVLWNILSYLHHWEIKFPILQTFIAAKFSFGETGYVTQIIQTIPFELFMCWVYISYLFDLVLKGFSILYSFLIKYKNFNKYLFTLFLSKETHSHILHKILKKKTQEKLFLVYYIS
jgi:hypothetical protein